MATGMNDYDVVVAMTLGAGQNLGSVWDKVFAPFDTTYTVTVRVSDSSGAVLASQSLTAITPSPK